MNIGDRLDVVFVWKSGRKTIETGIVVDVADSGPIVDLGRHRGTYNIRDSDYTIPMVQSYV